MDDIQETTYIAIKTANLMPQMPEEVKYVANRLRQKYGHQSAPNGYIYFNPESYKLWDSDYLEAIKKTINTMRRFKRIYKTHE